jgi:hypothetical protein
MKLNALAVALVLNVVAAAALAWLWSDSSRRRWAEPAPMPPAIDEVVVTPAAESAEVSRYRETLERPLFASSRRIAPRPPPGAEAQEAVDPLKDVRLLGTYGAGERGGVIVVRGGKVERVAIGASIGGWKVAGQEGRGATLVRASGERRKLDLALNSVAPSAPAGTAKPAESGAGKGSPAEAPRAPESPTPRAAEAAPPAPPRPATPERAAAGGNDEFAAQRRERLERLNARRAQRGLPPLNSQN